MIDFLKAVGAIGAGTLIGIARASSEVNALLGASFSQIGFDPTNSNSGFIVLLTDIHMAPSFSNLGTVEIDPRIIEEVNNMVPQPEMIIVSGDLATAATEYTGKVFTALDETRAREELALGMTQLARFNDNITLKIIPGNHDTYSYEEDAQLWAEYTGSAPYFTFNFHGLKFIMLNTAHDGALDTVQQDWFNNQVSSSLNEEEIYVVGHHPLGSAVGGRGINEAMKVGFTPYAGDVWYSAGHVHNFSFRGYVLNEDTSVIQSVTATASPDSFNPDGKSPGYSLICVSNGKVAHHYHRDVKVATIVARPNPSRNGPFRILPVPFGELDYPLVICEEGKYDRDQYIHAITAGDVSGTWWSYVDHLELDFDLSLYAGRAHQIVFLGSYRQAYDLTTEISLDGGQNWSSAENTFNLFKHIHVDIPAEAQSSNSVRLRLTQNAPSRFTFNFFLAGFAIIPRLETVTAYEQWRWEHFNTILDQGDAGSERILTGNGLTNIEKFAFNVPVDTDEILSVNPATGSYQGSPAIVKQVAQPVQFVFVRRKNVELVGIDYEVLESVDMKVWTEVNENQLTVTDLGGDWELVSYSLGDEESHFLRVELNEVLAVN